MRRLIFTVMVATCCATGLLTGWYLADEVRLLLVILLVLYVLACVFSMIFFWKFFKKYDRQQRILERLANPDYIATIDYTVDILENYQVLVKTMNYSYIPLEVFSEVTRTPEKDLTVWIREGLMPAREEHGAWLVPGVMLLLLFMDEKGRLHLHDDYHKPLIPSEVMSAAMKLLDHKTDSDD